MIKIPFRVSARTARLIGRENIASSKGAIIELVKNAYDADSDICIVYFDNKYAELSETFSANDYAKFRNSKVPMDLFGRVYEQADECYQLRNEITEADQQSLKSELRKLNALYIIDAGEGMTQQIIRNHWMIIGTDNKATDIFTKSGRVKAGAKGIGRFALDKLGNTTQMITFFNKEKHDADLDERGDPTAYDGYEWKVQWSDFEGYFKTIDNVHAELKGINGATFKERISEDINNQSIIALLDKYEFCNGTMLKITQLRDDWQDFYVDQVFSDLEVLIPPQEVFTFSISLHSSLHENKYGEVMGSICDDYDYKLVAKANKNQKVFITVYRREYDVDLIDPELFNREGMRKPHFTLADFRKGQWSVESSFSQLLSGFDQVDEDHVFRNIGEFDFTLYFMKKTYTTGDAEKYFYRKFHAKERQDWLGKFGGIKLFRDNFRVRPYGEVKNTAFDWLGLGARKSISPAGPAKLGGGYRVPPENVSGAIHISRLGNINFEDKSSREGLQENKTFLIFTKILANIIGVFEEDRAYIARQMSDYYKEKHSLRIDAESAEKLALQVLKKNKNKLKQSSIAGAEQTSPEVVLAQLNEEKNEEIVKLKDEQKVLGLASSGIVLASFSHDLSNLNDVLGSRIDKLKELLSGVILESDYSSIEARKNPFSHMEKMKQQDVKLKNWLKFSLGAARKDKRQRKKIYYDDYFHVFNEDWKKVLELRGINLNIDNVTRQGMRAFEIDIDSIFNNLLVNSIDAFKYSKENRDRKISISCTENGREIVLDYHDNGPGISSDIDNPEKIFEPLFTTKRNVHTGDEEGTGLGMWLVKSIAKDNDGDVKLLFPSVGFGIRIAFPIKYQRG